MDSRKAMETSLAQSNQIVETYLGDLSDADPLARAVPGSNHIAWQLGHLIAAENMMVDGVSPGSMPKLPEGFAKKYDNELAKSDDPSKFLKKDEYLALYKAQRQATLALLAKQSDEDFEKPAPEQFRSFAPTVGQLFAMQGSHWLMHAGQWAVTRRKLGKPPLF